MLIVTLGDRLHCETTDVQLRFCCSFFHVHLKAVNMSVCNPQGYQLRQIVAEMLYPADWEPTRRMNSGQGPRMSDLTSWAMQNTALWFAFINIIC